MTRSIPHILRFLLGHLKGHRLQATLNTLVGSFGLVAAAPLTALIASWLLVPRTRAAGCRDDALL